MWHISIELTSRGSVLAVLYPHFTTLPFSFLELLVRGWFGEAGECAGRHDADPTMYHDNDVVPRGAIGGFEHGVHDCHAD
jgi:hypothetical protein